MQDAKGRYITGLIIIAFGVLALLNNFGLTHISLSYLFNLLWPLLLFGAGISLITHRDLPGVITGAILISLGVLFFGRNAGLFDFDMTYFWQGFWPVIIILIGINILFKSSHNTPWKSGLMGAVDKTKETWDLHSSEYTAIMGGIELDVRKANFSERDIFLTLTAIMGGITVILPEDAAVTCKGHCHLGRGRNNGQGIGRNHRQYQHTNRRFAYCGESNPSGLHLYYGWD